MITSPEARQALCGRSIVEGSGAVKLGVLGVKLPDLKLDVWYFERGSSSKLPCTKAK